MHEAFNGTWLTQRGEDKGRKIHKIAVPKDEGKAVFMLCRPSETGKNDEAKSVNWKNVTCARCHAFEGFEGYGAFY